MTSTQYDLIVIGSGPGGYVAAIRAAQLGMKVACIEKEKTLGGTCLNVGCIPSKALLESSELYVQTRHKLGEHGINVKNVALDLGRMMERKQSIVTKLTGGIGFLFKKNKIEWIPGSGRLAGDKTVIITMGKEEKTLSAKSILIATGSTPISIPPLPVDQKTIVDSTGALSLTQVPENLVVVGGGYIGLELGSVYARLGSKVTVVEALERIVPMMDLEVGGALKNSLQKQGLTFSLSTKVKGVERSKKGLQVLVEKDGKEEKIATDVILVSIGRKPCTEGLGLKEAGIQIDDKGRIAVNSNFETSVKGVYAIGDVIAGPMLAHKASEEGVAVAEILAGQKGHVNYAVIPSVVYTWPEVATVGLTEEEIKAKGIDYKKSRFPFAANGRALSLGETEGFVKLIADKKTDRLLGAHIIGPRASEMIAELTLALEYSASGEDIARTIHAHPTLPEAIKEAALALGDGAIHS